MNGGGSGGSNGEDGGGGGGGGTNGTALHGLAKKPMYMVDARAAAAVLLRQIADEVETGKVASYSITLLYGDHINTGHSLWGTLSPALIGGMRCAEAELIAKMAASYATVNGDPSRDRSASADGSPPPR